MFDVDREYRRTGNGGLLLDRFEEWRLVTFTEGLEFGDQSCSVIGLVEDRGEKNPVTGWSIR